ncbi:MAG: MarR family winged helix-turn-helix transcriptional regulator [Actinomycetota bacterium]
MASGPLRVEADHARRYPGADKLATECVVNLIRTESLVVAELDRLFRSYHLTGPGFNVLMIIQGAGRPLSPYEIGDRRLVTRGTVTGLLDTLEKQGLVRRTPHPDDRRMLWIELTDRGRALLAEVSHELFPAQAEMMSALSERQRDTLIRLLGKLQTHLQNRSEGVEKPLEDVS